MVPLLLQALVLLLTLLALLRLPLVLPLPAAQSLARPLQRGLLAGQVPVAGLRPEGQPRHSSGWPRLAPYRQLQPVQCH